MGNSLSFFTEDTGFQIKHKNKLRLWLSNTLLAEGVSRFTVNIIVCSDNYLRNLNRDYLQHDYFTDVISFNYDVPGCLTGDVFLSIDRVEANALEFKVPAIDELHRVMVHGVLHLAGHNDATPALRSAMKKKEDHYLSLFPD